MRDERRTLTLLRVSGAVVLLLSLVMLVVFPAAPVEQNVPGFVSPVVGFELAATPDHVFGILGAPGDARREAAVVAMNRGNRIDFLFMIAYPALYVGIVRMLRVRGRLAGAVGWIGVLLPGVMWLGDVLENRELLALATMTDPVAMTDGLARLRPCTLLKWYAIFGASALVAYPIWQDPSWWRWCGVVFGIAAGAGFGSLLHLPLIEVAAYLLSLAWLGTWVYSLRA